MALKVVGAGLGRTGTNSLKLALERLLGEPCYHMLEVFPRPDHPATWAAAYDGSPPDWQQMFTGFGAAVDWPAAGLWSEIAEAFPDALILLSDRDADSWWRSASTTIFTAMGNALAKDPAGAWTQMAGKMLAAFTPDWRDEFAAKAAFVAHNDNVRASAPADRLLEWRPADGWAPICERLGLAVPDEPFPHTNTTEDFLAMMGAES
jgi:hypothetical protein